MKELSVESLKNIVTQYPWYFDAKVILAGKTAVKTGVIADPVLRLHFTGRPYPEILLTKPTANDFFPPSPTEKIIESFLSKEIARIKPLGDESVSNEDISLSSVAENDELYTEELAEIYLRQGLKSKSLDIYAKLSLLNPEKSVYFAELIDRIKKDN